jgi:hypothetical protein
MRRSFPVALSHIDTSAVTKTSWAKDARRTRMAFIAEIQAFSANSDHEGASFAAR